MRALALAMATLSVLASCSTEQQPPSLDIQATAADPAPYASSPLAGQWRAAESGQERAARLRAIDDAIARARLPRGMARDRLAGITAPPESLSIEIDGATVTVASDGPGVTLELGARPVEVTSSQGGGRVSAATENERLLLVARNGRGERRTAYSAHGDNLQVDVTMTGEKFPDGLKYTTTYVRAETAARAHASADDGDAHEEVR